jgi:hypothetical protein
MKQHLISSLASVALALVVLFSLQGMASADPQACAKENPAVCAELQLPTYGLGSEAPESFLIQAMAPAGQEIVALEASIEMNMMNMRHGSAPVTVTPKGNNLFQIEDAQFVMQGSWDVVLVLTTSDQTKYKLIIPVFVNH